MNINDDKIKTPRKNLGIFMFGTIEVILARCKKMFFSSLVPGNKSKENRITKPPYEYWYRKQFIIIFILLFLLSGCEQVFAYTDNQICEAIGRAENSTKYPYGIKSINTYGNKEYAQKICINTIHNNRKRFANQTKYKDYIEFLGSRFCPPNIHKLNVNWVKNVRYFLKELQ
jgi:hypothetical protein